jgi:hypothetical protein
MSLSSNYRLSAPALGGMGIRRMDPIKLMVEWISFEEAEYSKA